MCYILIGLFMLIHLLFQYVYFSSCTMFFYWFDDVHALSATSTHFKGELMLYCLHCPTLNKVFLLSLLLLPWCRIYAKVNWISIVRPSACYTFYHVSIIVSSSNFQGLLPLTERWCPCKRSRSKVKVTEVKTTFFPNLGVSGLKLQFELTWLRNDAQRLQCH